MKKEHSIFAGNPILKEKVPLELHRYLDLALEIRIELGQSKIKLHELIKMQTGGVLVVEKFAGEPLDILLNGKVIAHGEAVVVNDRLAVRMTDIIGSVETFSKEAVSQLPEGE